MQRTIGKEIQTLTDTTTWRRGGIIEYSRNPWKDLFHPPQFIPIPWKSFPSYMPFFLPRACAFLKASTLFFARPRRFSNLDVSMEAARRRTDFPGFASGFSIHHDDLPVPSFWTRINRLWSDKLCRIEFCKKGEETKKDNSEKSILCKKHSYLKI